MIVTMKTKIFAVINSCSLVAALILLEFMELSFYGKVALIATILLFVISGVMSVFHQKIWRSAHGNYEVQSKAFLIDVLRLITSIITTTVVVLSILVDFLTIEGNFVLFISYLVIYGMLTIPCHLVIFKKEYLVEASV